MKEHAVEVFFLFVLIAITLLIGAYLYRVLRGPTVYDRVLGLNGISTKAIILLVVIGTVYERVEMFVDIATGYALVNLVGSLAIAKYLEERGKSANVSE
jgi:multicomponent Na+:H+ antiporter subunit F